MQENRPQSWRDWYSFARETLGYEPPEATEYANLRFAEELNRSAGGHPAGRRPLRKPIRNRRKTFAGTLSGEDL